MNTHEPAKNSNQPPDPRQLIVRVIAVILGATLIALPLHSILCSVLDLPSLPFSGIVLAILAIIVLVRWRSWAKKSPAVSISSPQPAGPRPRALFGGIALACGAAQLCCFGACYSHVHGSGANVALSLFGVGFLLTFPTLGCALFGMARREQPKWPAAVGGLIGASPFVIAIMAGIYIHALQPIMERVGHASLSDPPAKTAPAHPPTANETPPMTPADAPAKPSGSPTDRLSSDDRLRWCAEALHAHAGQPDLGRIARGHAITRAALSTYGRTKKPILISRAQRLRLGYNRGLKSFRRALVHAEAGPHLSAESNRVGN